MYTEELTIEKIEIINFNTIQIKKINRILKDGNEIASNIIRCSYMKDDKFYDEDYRILAIAKAIWPEKFAENLAE